MNFVEVLSNGLKQHGTTDNTTCASRYAQASVRSWHMLFLVFFYAEIYRAPLFVCQTSIYIALSMLFHLLVFVPDP